MVALSKLVRMDRAVMEHTTRVSANTSNTPQRPCFTGSFTLEVAWAMEAEPRPASLENTPRATP